MRKIVLAGAILFPILWGCDQSTPPSAPVQAEAPKPTLSKEERDSLVAKATAGMAAEHDKMESISFYTVKSDNMANTGLSTYVAVPDQGRAIFRVMPHFHADTWIFFNQIKVMADDKIVYDKSFQSVKMSHDNNSAGVFESIDYAADPSDIAAMREIAAAKSVTVRLSGREKREDFDLKTEDKQRIARSLKAYDDLAPL
jgi:hypothetical protein